ncbi:MAG: ParB/RepB/Spo0J family partition protein [Bacteroidota bacterium]|nr:ParB/RepB/Spo0J family partition protein [Bacteroidota bacterium]
MSKSKFGLGRGLGTLLPTEEEAGEQAVSIVPTAETRDDGVSSGILAHIEIARIQPNPYQPRTEFEPEALAELVQSIRENGVVQPITVRRFEDGYQLITGERRVRACREAGVKFIPAYIRAVASEEEMLELALIENLQRETLNPIEIAQSYKRLIDEYHHTQDEIARKVGKNRATVANFIRLLKLPDTIQESIRKGEISFGHARALINIPDRQAQLRLWKKTVHDGLSVRQVEDLARNPHERRKGKAEGEKEKKGTPTAFEDIAARLRSRYATKVRITSQESGAGTITLEFYSAEDLERIVELLLE